MWRDLWHEAMRLAPPFRLRVNEMIEIGIDSFVVKTPGVSAADSLTRLMERIEWADQVGIDVFGIGEHHKRDWLDSAPAILLAAAATRTQRIRLSSAVTVLSADDPVRVFQQFATLDLLSKGRAELVVGRGSNVEAYPLFGYALQDYDALFSEKLGLLLELRENENPVWSGKFRPALTGQGVYPRPFQQQLPIWLGVGGTPQSFARAGSLGLPLMIAIIGGETRSFRPLVDLYRESGRRAGFGEDQLKVGLHSVGYVAESTEQAIEDFFPGYVTAMTTASKERGWPLPTRRSFDAQRGPHGAYLIGGPDEVAAKIRNHSEALGGVSRVSFQMDFAGLPHEKLMSSLELLGRRVKPLLEQAKLQPG